MIRSTGSIVGRYENPLAALDAIKDDDEDLCGSVSRTTGESNFEFIKSPIKSGEMKWFGFNDLGARCSTELSGKAQTSAVEWLKNSPQSSPRSAGRLASESVE